jgi:hypothetical protein
VGHFDTLPVGYVEKVVRTGAANELTMDVGKYLRDHVPLFPNFTLPEREFGDVRYAPPAPQDGLG